MSEKTFVDKMGNEHFFIRDDFRHPAYIKVEITEEQKSQISKPTHIIKAESHLDVPSWRILEPAHKIIFEEFDYGFIEIVDNMVLLWFNTTEEAEDAETKLNN